VSSIPAGSGLGPRSRAAVVPAWARFVLSRLVGLACVLAVLVVATFLVVRLIPGDPARQVAGPLASKEVVDNLRADLGLDRPAAEQFVDYAGGVVKLDFGESFVSGEPVRAIIGDRFAKTAQLALVSLVLVLVLGTAIGMWAAALTEAGRHPLIEGIFTAVTGGFASIAPYVSGTLLVFVFAVQFDLLPVAGSSRPESIILPAISVALVPAATVARFAKAETSKVLRADYIRSARAKRLGAPTLYLRHVLPNVLTATLTSAGVFFAQLMGGAIVAENVFSWPGLGTALINAVLGKDYLVVQGVALFLGLVIVLVNAAVDLLLAAVNPRSALRSS
jgi:peptide/nickel transport system permease protein